MTHCITCIYVFSGYCGPSNLFAEHNTVNHQREFVSSSSSGPVTTNTLEGTHGVLKMKARRLNLFSGNPSNNKSFIRKIEELVFRFNHRNEFSDDSFLVFLHLVAVATMLKLRLV